MNETKEILRNQFKRLPKDLQDAILALDLRAKMQFITKKNNLHIDQAGALENETVFVMLGLEHPDDLIYNIAKHMEVSKQKAEVIAEDLNREIFLKVRDSLKKIFEERNAEGSSFLANNLLGKTEEESAKTKTEEMEEELNREKILREIEDKEHHDLPTVAVKQELQDIHLETKFPGDSSNSNLEVKPSNAPQVAKALDEKSNDIFRKKMSGVVNAPKETININEPPLPTKKFPSDANSKKIDPYREQIGG